MNRLIGGKFIIYVRGSRLSRATVGTAGDTVLSTSLTAEGTG